MESEQKETSQRLRKQANTLAEAALTQYYRANPGSQGITNSDVRQKSLQDMHYHVLYLAEAIAARRPVLFTHYTAWLRDTLTGLGLDEKDIISSLVALEEIINETFPEAREEVGGLIARGIEEMQSRPVIHQPSYIAPEEPFGPLAAQYLHFMLNGNRAEAARLVMDEFQQGKPVKDIYLHVFQPVQREIGRLWQTNQISVAKEHYCTAATQLIMSQFYPYFFTTPKNGRVMVATCVGGEMHEIGMRMVADIFEMEQWDTYYLGANTPTKSILGVIRERKAHLLCISATMIFHVSEVRRLVAAIREDQECGRVKILVGGYPFNVAPDLWKEIGADGYGMDAESAVAVANHLYEGRE